MSLDWKFPYPSQRTPLLAQNAVATSHPLAAQAGLRMLLRGGNAVDAALAAIISLNVLEPVSTGIGGDAFALIWDGSTLRGINGSGHSPRSWSPEKFAGRNVMPQDGWGSITIPGAVAAWTEISKKFGRLPFADLFSPAVEYARRGFLLTPYIARTWKALLPSYRKYPEISELFTDRGVPPPAGTLFRLPRHAETLSEIAETEGASFYTGRLAEKMVRHARSCDQELTLDDFASQTADWVQPLSQQYHGFSVDELPPNGQGLAALIALGILDHFDLFNFSPDSAESIHLQIEAMKLAFADAYRHIGDSDAMSFGASSFLDPEYLKLRAQSIDLDRAQFPDFGAPRDAGTVYVTTSDASGMMVSMMQSNGRGFGSGIVVPDTGICLHSRGSAFSLEPNHPNQVSGRKRPFHTIVPAFVRQGDRPIMSFGVMGFNMQPQAHVQFAVRLIDHQQNPQAISDAPRWRIAHEERAIVLERGFPESTARQLTERGHTIVETEKWSGASTPFGSALAFGGAQLIYKLPDGYLAASDHRRDGQAIGY
jgi:gamma-glutamyltranspeptidase / glutathione hydrolase